ncbi:MAG: methyltransferase [Gammaproteobacteria bacterium]|nr:methyltransferase [Gammaproteobacteria bacterium]
MLELIPFSAPTSNDAQRVFHGRGHAFPGYEHVSIDWLSPVMLITLYKAVDEQALKKLAEKLKQSVTDCLSVQAQYRYLNRAPFEVVLGEPIANLIATENGLKYHISLGKAQNTGLFLDMSNGREWVQQQAKGANVLNLFAYTCGFSVAALAGGAEQVVNVDMSRRSLTVGRENHRLNQQVLSKVTFEGVDIFKSFGRLKKHGLYQLLVCDPPSFQKGSVDIKRDYKKIIRRIPEFMAPDSLLMLCLNSPDLDEDFLLETVKSECKDCVFQRVIASPEVFVEAVEGKGLKVLIFKYLPEPSLVYSNPV